jgi:hypothetical protein
MVKTVQENLEKYENQFGKIEASEEPKGIGFK